MIRFTIYKDLDYADAIRLDYDTHYFYVDLCRCPDDDDFSCYTNLWEAIEAYQAIIMQQNSQRNLEYTVFLCVEEVTYDEGEEEIRWSTPIDCYMVYKGGGRNIILSGIDAKQPDDYYCS